MRVVDTATYCSSCHCQDTKAKYVDFDAYWDGPTLDTEGQIKVPIDDLVLCETCLSAAAGLIGMIHNKQMVRENYELGKALEAKDKTIEIQAKAISNLEHTLGLSLSGKLKRGRGRPVVQLPNEATVKE